jgi:hypothetical protein
MIRNRGHHRGVRLVADLLDPTHVAVRLRGALRASIAMVVVLLGYVLPMIHMPGTIQRTSTATLAVRSVPHPGR